MRARPINAKNEIISLVGMVGGRYQRDVMDIMPVKLASRRKSTEARPELRHQSQEPYHPSTTKAGGAGSRLMRMQEGLQRHKQNQR